LNDSTVVQLSTEAKKVALFEWEDGRLGAGIRVEWPPLKIKNPDEVLCSFCQKIWLHGLAASHGALTVAGITAQSLFQSFDNAGSFKRDKLSFGIQGLQELDWSKQNTVMMNDTDTNQISANKFRLLFGPDNRFMLDVDKGMLELLGIAKFKIHDVDIKQQQQKRSYQLFANIKHDSFTTAFVDESKTEPENWVCIHRGSKKSQTDQTQVNFGQVIRLALIIFEEASAYMNNPANRTEQIRLVETIQKNMFLQNSVLLDADPMEEVNILVALDDAKDDIHAAAETVDNPQPTSSQPLSPSVPSSSSTTMAPSINLPLKTKLVSDKAKVTAKAKKKRQQQKKKERMLQDRLGVAEGQKNSESSAVDQLQSQLSGIKLATPTTSNADVSPSPPLLQKQGLGEMGGMSSDSREGMAQSKADVSDCHSDVGVSEVASPISENSDQTITQTDFNQSVSRGSFLPEQQSGRPANTANMAEVVETRPIANQWGLISDSSSSLALPFKFDSYHPRLKCPMEDCGKLTNCWGKFNEHAYLQNKPSIFGALTDLSPDRSACGLLPCLWPFQLRPLLLQGSSVRRYRTTLVI